MSKKINKRRLFRNLLIVLILGGCIAGYFANRFVKTKGFEGLGEFVTNYRENSVLKSANPPDLLELKIDEEDFTFLENKRQEALERGIQINEGDNYVKCKVIFKGDTVKGEMRLKGHMTDHLEGDKWSFRVKTKDEIMGMYRFSLQNPGTRYYYYEWIYHQLLKNEDVIALKYNFLKLKLNDKDLGIYAVEEHFGQHVLRDNKRPEGAILRWNPELYWEGRIDGLHKRFLDEQYSHYSSSFVEPYDRGNIKDSDELIENYKQGATLLEAFRRGEKSTAEVFDVERMARFHAVIDLVGGHHSLDWSDIKLFYNANTQMIEPVGYESFSIRKSERIAGQRIADDYESVGFDYHNKLFADSTYFASYIKNLERIASKAYFSNFMAKIQDRLDQHRGVLAHEYAYIRYSLEPYYENIDLIQHNLELPKAFHAFINDKTDSTVTFAITPVSDFPIVVTHLVNNKGDTLPLQNLQLLSSKPRNTFTHYHTFTEKRPKGKVKDYFLIAHIPGSEHHFGVEVTELPSYEIPVEVKEEDSTQALPELFSALNDSVWVPSNTETYVNSSCFIPAGKTLKVYAGQELNFGMNGSLNIAGKVEMIGTEDFPINVKSEDTLQPKIFINKGSFTVVNTQFSHLGNGFIQAVDGKLHFEKSAFAAINQNFIVARHSNVKIINSVGGEIGALGKFDRCLVRIKNLTVSHGDTLITAHGSDIELYNSEINDYRCVANLSYNANLYSWRIDFKDIDLLAALNDHTYFRTIASNVKGGNVGFYMNQKGGIKNEATYDLYSTPHDLQTLVKKHKRS